MNRRLALVALLASTLVLAGCLGGFDPTEADAPWDDSDADEPASVVDTLDGGEVLEIHHLDVGQADATLVIEPGGETMVIDTGDWRDDGEAVLEALDDRGVDRIDHLVSTHAHADHIGGHAAVIEHYETEREGVGAIYDSGVATGSRTYERYLDAVEAHDVPLYRVEEGDALPFGDADVTFHNPPAGESGDDLHENSVALTIEYGEVTYLTTGDAEADAEARMVDARGGSLDADVYQAGHHGSSTSSSEPFLDRVDPRIAVISSDYDSQYGHPHDEVLESLAARDVETYWTAVHGDVLVATDGAALAVGTEREAPTDAAALLAEKPDDSDGDGARVGLPRAAGPGQDVAPAVRPTIHHPRGGTIAP